MVTRAQRSRSRLASLLLAFFVQQLAFTAPGYHGQSLPGRILRRAESSDSRDEVLPAASVEGHLLASNLTGTELLNVLREAPRQGDARVKSAEVLRCLTANGMEGSKGAISCTDAVDFTKSLWRGNLRLPREVELDLTNLGAALIISLDDDQDGVLSLDEFIEYAAVMVQLSDSQERDAPSHDDDLNLDLLLNLTTPVLAKPTFLAILRHWAQSSCKMLSKRLALLGDDLDAVPLQSYELALLSRAASDAVTLAARVKLCPRETHGRPMGSPAVDAAVLAIFQETNASAAAGAIRNLFEELVIQWLMANGTVLSIVQAFWSGRLNLPKKGMEDFRMDASALMVVVDRRRSGSFTLGEFTEFFETLVEVARTYDTVAPNLTETQFLRRINDVSDSFFTFLRDLRYGIFVVKKRFKGKLSLLEQAMLRRTARDVLSLLPYVVLARSFLTPALKIFLCILLWKNVPVLSPSASTEPRQRFARAWASIAVKQRSRAMTGWQLLEGSDLIGDIKRATDNRSQRQQVKKLFSEFDEGGGTLTYGQVFAIVKPLIRGRDCLNELGLIIQIASDNDGAVTEPEFVEFVESLLIAQKIWKAPEPDVKDIKLETSGITKVSWNASLQQKFQNFRMKVVKRVKKEVRELMDSVSMISLDFAYSAALLRSPGNSSTGTSRAWDSRFSPVERAWLRRTVKDVVLFLPIAAIIIAPLTPAGN
eukprot:Skav218125  [mRNA]  locus=scaffold759:286187:292201:- [translate_table: standard]